MASKRPQSEFVRLVPTSAAEVRRVEDEKSAPCVLSAVDCASGIALSGDRLTASSRLGYRSVRAVHGVHKGYFLFEVAIASLGDTGAVRVGVQTQWADLHGPVGMDQHGYGVCSTTGSAVHESVPKQMGGRFGEGDVVGVAVFLPDANAPRTRVREAVTWSRKLYWTQEPPAEAHEPVEGSFVEFYVNGESLGRFKNVKTGTYFPTLSLFTGEQNDPARARCDFSQPRFAHRYPPACVPWSEGRFGEDVSCTSEM